MAKIQLTQENLRSLYRAFEFYYPDGTVFAKDATFSDGNLRFEGLSDFLQDIEDTSEIEVDARDLKSIKAAQVAIEQKFTEATKKEKAEANKPEDLEQLKAEEEKRAAAIKETEEKARKDTEAAVKRAEKYAEQKRIINEQLAKSKAAEAEIANKKIYVKVVEPPKPVLSNEEQIAYQKLKELAVKDPKILQEQLAQAIESKIPDVIKAGSTYEETKLYAGSVAADAVTALANPAPIQTDNETAILISVATNNNVIRNSVSDIDSQSVLIQGTNDLARLKMSNYVAKSSALDLVVGSNVRQLIVGGNPAEAQVLFTGHQDGANYNLDLGKINDNYQTILQNPVLSAAESQIKNKVFDYGKQQLLGKISSLSPDSYLGQAAASKEFQAALTLLQPYTSFEFVGAEGIAGSFGKLIFQLSPESAPFISAFGNMVGIDFGIAPITSTVAPVALEAAVGEGLVTTTAAIGGEAVAGGAVAAGTGAAATVGAEVAATATGVAVGAEVAAGGAAAGATAGAAAGTAIPVPVVGTIIGAIAGFLIGIVAPSALKWVTDKYNKNKEMFIAAPIALLVGIFAGPIAGLATGIGSFGIASAATGAIPFSKILTNLVSKILNIFGAVWNSFLGAISGPLIGFFIGFPLLVIFIIVIINNSAYLTPPGLAQTASTNPYISVSKTANPSGQLSSPTTITYTVTITAKTDTLTGITIKGDCHAQKKGSSLSCPPEQIPVAPASISPGSPFTFTFTGNYDSKYQDALISDTITVTAKSNAGGNVSEIGSASVCFGKCPLDCFNFPDAYWPQDPSVQNLKGLLTGAIGTLSGTYPNFAAKVCKAGTINLCYKPSILQPGIFAWHEHAGTCDIDFGTQVASYGAEGTLFLLTHEVTHHIQTISPNYFVQFMDQVNPPKSEPYICTRNNPRADESMAEGDALFVARPIIDKAAGCLTSSFQSQYPKHYNFAKNVMFAP